MATLGDVERIVASLPDTGGSGLGGPSVDFHVMVGDKARKFVYSWRKRVHPKKTRVPQLDVLVVLVANEGEKQTLIAADPDVYFTEPHYDGYPAVLVRIAAIDVPELSEIITEAWRLTAPGPAVAEFDAAHR